MGRFLCACALVCCRFEFSLLLFVKITFCDRLECEVSGWMGPGAAGLRGTARAGGPVPTGQISERHCRSELKATRNRFRADACVRSSFSSGHVLISLLFDDPGLQAP